MNDLVFEEKELRIIDLKKANLIGVFFLLGFFIIYSSLYFLIWKDDLSIDFIKSYLPKQKETLLLFVSGGFLVIFVLGIIVHELIHGVFWAIFAKGGWKSIKFGYLKKTATPYCHCKEPLLLWQYFIGAIMPFVLLGLVPAIWALASGNIFLLMFAIFFSAAAVGDLMIINLMRKEERSVYVQDHPSEAGYYVFRKIS